MTMVKHLIVTSLLFGFSVAVVPAQEKQTKKGGVAKQPNRGPRGNPFGGPIELGPDDKQNLSRSARQYCLESSKHPAWEA